MRHLALFLFVACLVAIAHIGHAYGSPKSRKPYVCLTYSIAVTDAANDDAVGICYDTAKPRMFYRFEVVTIPDAVTGRRKVMVGWP